MDCLNPLAIHAINAIPCGSKVWVALTFCQWAGLTFKSNNNNNFTTLFSDTGNRVPHSSQYRPPNRKHITRYKGITLPHSSNYKTHTQVKYHTTKVPEQICPKRLNAMGNRLCKPQLLWQIDQKSRKQQKNSKALSSAVVVSLDCGLACHSLSMDVSLRQDS